MPTDGHVQNVSHAPSQTMIHQIRWWSKDSALRKVFKSFANRDHALYIDLIVKLMRIEEDQRTKPDACVKSYEESLLKDEIVLTAQIYLHIFELTTPLSKYLQASGMDFLRAHQVVSTTQEEIKIYTWDFDAVGKQQIILWLGPILICKNLKIMNLKYWPLCPKRGYADRKWLVNAYMTNQSQTQ